MNYKGTIIEMRKELLEELHCRQKKLSANVTDPKRCESSLRTVASLCGASLDSGNSQPLLSQLWPIEMYSSVNLWADDWLFYNTAAAIAKQCRLEAPRNHCCIYAVHRCTPNTRHTFGYLPTFVKMTCF